MRTNGLCVMSCFASEFAEEIRRLCLKCPENCVSCPNEYDCLQCAPGSFLEKQQCSKCHNSCRECSAPSETDCLSCLSDSFLSSGRCLKCEISQFFDAESKFCIPCHSSCSECQGPLAGDCLMCFDNSVSVDGECSA